MDSLGKRIAAERKKKNMSQTEFAEYFKIGRSTVAMWETDDRKPDAKTLVDLAKFFNVSLDYLMSGIEHSSIDEKLHLVMSDPKTMNMFYDFASATDEEKEMLLEIWNSIKKRGKNK